RRSGLLSSVSCIRAGAHFGACFADRARHRSVRHLWPQAFGLVASDLCRRRRTCALSERLRRHRAVFPEGGLFAPVRRQRVGASPRGHADVRADPVPHPRNRRPAALSSAAQGLRWTMNGRAWVVGLALAALGAAQAAAQSGTTDKLYVMDCGHNAANDQSRWSPGVNVGKPIELSDNCYLIRHGNDWLLWDTGYPDSVAENSLTTPIGTATRPKKLAAQLAEVGVKPEDVKYVAGSHPKGDQAGTVDLSPASTLLIQKAEFDWAFAPDKKPPFKAERPIRKLEGDLDVFGDGSVTIISTPGHTP